MISYDVLPLSLHLISPSLLSQITTLFSTLPPNILKEESTFPSSTPINVTFMPITLMQFGTQMSPMTLELLNVMVTFNLHPFPPLWSILHCFFFNLSVLYTNIPSRLSFSCSNYFFAGYFFLKYLLRQIFLLSWFPLWCVMWITLYFTGFHCKSQFLSRATGLYFCLPLGQLPVSRSLVLQTQHDQNPIHFASWSSHNPYCFNQLSYFYSWHHSAPSQLLTALKVKTISLLPLAHPHPYSHKFYQLSFPQCFLHPPPAFPYLHCYSPS